MQLLLQIYQLIGTRFRLDPEHTVFIDDSQANVAAAAALGYQTHHFTSASRLEGWLVNEALHAPA